MDCIILAGGLGTRLSSVVQDKPKCMADVNGKPFLDYLLEDIESQGLIDNVILSLGHRHEQVIDWLKDKAFLFKITWVIEKELKGTGGAIKYALNKSKSDKVMVINGDTIFKLDWKDFIQSDNQNSEILMAVRHVDNANRYGSVTLNKNGQITEFQEKSDSQNSGYINAGFYLIDRNLFQSFDIPDPFSFEKDILPVISEKGTLYGKVYEDYFIDIGIPEDYNQFIEDNK